MSNQNLEDRLFEFAVRLIEFTKTLKDSAEHKIIKYQLIKSGTSSGANYEESQGAISKPDFFNKVNISLKEMRESNYWLRILNRIKDNENDELEYLVKESEELKKILGSISSKNRK